MTLFIQLRENIRHFMVEKETKLLRVWTFVISLAAMLTINEAFGYQKALNHWWIAVLVAAICSVLPLQGGTVILIFFMLLHLMALSTDVAVTTFLMFLICYGICGYFHSKSTYHLMSIPVLHQLGAPYVIPMGTALLRDTDEIVAVICGSFLSFYLKTVRDNASVFLDPTSQVGALELMQSQMLSNHLFYFYLAAMVMMFLVVYYVRNKDMNHSWLVAALSGCLVEFTILLAGYLFTGNYSSVFPLIIGNVITFAVGCAVNYLFLNLDYSRTEWVQFEDDEYYYYVTAVPKIHIAAPEKEIKKITEEDIEKTELRKGFRWRRRERK